MVLNYGQTIGLLMVGGGGGAVLFLLYQQAKPWLERKQAEMLTSREQEWEKEEIKDEAIRGLKALEKHEKEIEKKKGRLEGMERREHQVREAIDKHNRDQNLGPFEKEVKKRKKKKKKKKKSNSISEGEVHLSPIL